MMSNLHQTMCGKKLFENDIPLIIQSFRKIHEELQHASVLKEDLLRLKERELELKEKELELKEKELDQMKFILKTHFDYPFTE
jgi:hypothetical protein